MTIKQYLDDEYWKWQSGDRKKTLIQFAEYLGVEYGALTSWMSGIRKPRYENVVKLAEKLGPRAYDILGYARPGQMGIGDCIAGKLMSSWDRLTPEQQSEVEDFFSTITAEELVLFLRDACRMRKREKRGGGDVPVSSRQSSD